MRQSTRRLGICVALCWTLPAGLAGCSSAGEAAREERQNTGTLAMALGGVGTQGNRYRLRSAQFTLDGPTNDTFSSEDFLGQEQMTRVLPAGPYTLTLAGDWFLERLTVNGYRRVVNAELASNVVSTIITEGNVSAVAFQFQIGEEVVTPGGDGDGTLWVNTEFTETGISTACGNGVVDAGESCDDGNQDPCDGCAGCAEHAPPATGAIVAQALVTEDTIWCAAQSPIHLTSTMVVLQGATLFVGPGVRVEADAGTGITVRGALEIRGTTEAPVVFTSAAAVPEPGAWAGISMTSVPAQTVVEGVVIEYAQLGLAGTSTVLKNSRFAYNVTAASGVGTVSDSLFEQNTNGISGDVVAIVRSVFRDQREIAVGNAQTITASTFERNGIGGTSVFACGASGCAQHGAAVMYAGRVEDSIFANNDVAIDTLGILVDSRLVANVIAASRASEIEHSLVADNGTGVRSLSGAVRSNTFVRNGGSARIGSGTVLHRNTLCSGSEIELTATDIGLVDATDNYWCTGDAAVIASRVFDVLDNPELGPIVFEPFLASPPEEAPADPGPPASGG